MWWIPLVVIIVVVLATSLPGFIAYRYFKPKTLWDFMAAGKTLGLFAVTLSVGATQWSALSFMGFIAFYYIHGVPGWLAMGLAYMLISVFLYGFLGYRVNKLAERYKAVTPSDAVELFFKDKVTAVITGLLFFIALLPYMQVQIGGIAYILEVSSGGRIPFIYGALIAYIVMAAYMWFGGLKSIAWANILQGVFFLALAFGIGAYMLVLAGGTTGISQLATTMPQAFMLPGIAGVMTAAYLLSWSIPVQLGWPLQPQIYMQFAAAKRKEFLFYLPALIPIAATGLYFMQQVITWLAGRVLYPKGFPPGPDKLLITILYERWHPILFGLVGGAGMAAMMSTLSTQALAIGSAFVNDILRRIAKIEERKALIILKIIMILALFGGLILWFVMPWLLMTLGALSAAIGAITAISIIPALFNIRFVTKYGASAGMILGFAVLVYTTFVAKDPLGLYSGFWGMFTAVVTCIIVSLFTRKYRPQPLQY
jgi:SSS family solute:Na+ symporter